MSFSSKVGSFALNIATGNQVITGVGFQPKIVLLFATDRTSDGSQYTTLSSFIAGVGISASDRCTLSTACTSDAYISISNCLNHYTGTDPDNFLVDFVSLDTDGFTINISHNNGIAAIINYIALGGTDITNVGTTSFTQKLSTGYQDITSLGFQPDLMLFFYNGQTAFGSLKNYIGFSYGAATASAQHTSGFTNLYTSYPYKVQVTDKVIALAGTSIDSAASLDQMLSNGFRLNWSVSDGYYAYKILAVGIKGGRYKLGSFNQNTSTGNQSITGSGFLPSTLLLGSFCIGATASPTIYGRIAMGGATGASNRFTQFIGNTRPLSGRGNVLDRTKLISLYTENSGANPTLNAAADLVSFDADGFTINNTTADATSRQILYIAMGADSGQPTTTLGTTPTATTGTTPTVTTGG